MSWPEVQTGEGAVVATVQSDELGRFRVTLEDGRRYRLRVVRADASAVETSWFSL